MKANAIAKRKGATVVGIVLDDDEKAAKPSCMSFDEFILKITKILRRTSTSTSTSPSLIIPQTKEARLGWGSYLFSIELPLQIRISRRQGT